MTPTARTLQFLRENGWTADKAEYWNSYSRTRKDLFGIADIVSYRPQCPQDAIRGDSSPSGWPYVGWGLAFVQATSASNVSAREAKLRDSPHTWGLLKSGAIVAIIGWAKRGPRGKRKLWEPVIRQIQAP